MPQEVIAPAAFDLYRVENISSEFWSNGGLYNS